MNDLVLVRPPPLGDEARKRAMKGIEILENATITSSLGEALRGADLVAGTTGVVTGSEKRFLRIALGPREFVERIRRMHGLVAILFGREDFGLFEEELERCDVLVTISVASDYPILNVSHAVAILLYELSATRGSAATRKASGLEKERLHEAFAALLHATDYPPHKRGRTSVMFRRLVGRATPSKWEFHALMGVFQRATKRIRRLEQGRK